MQIIPDPIFALWLVLPFLTTMIGLNFLLVRPMREYLEGRDDAIHGARHDAEHLNHAADAKLADLEKQLAAARAGALAVREAARQRGLAYESEVIDAARKQAEGQLSTALDEISADATAARSALRDNAQLLSVDIAGRILGRSVDA